VFYLYSPIPPLNLHYFLACFRQVPESTQVYIFGHAEGEEYDYQTELTTLPTGRLLLLVYSRFEFSRVLTIKLVKVFFILFVCFYRAGKERAKDLHVFLRKTHNQEGWVGVAERKQNETALDKYPVGTLLLYSVMQLVYILKPSDHQGCKEWLKKGGGYGMDIRQYAMCSSNKTISNL
jgi:hypothetical protein